MLQCPASKREPEIAKTTNKNSKILQALPSQLTRRKNQRKLPAIKVLIPGKGVVIVLVPAAAKILIVAGVKNKSEFAGEAY